MNQTQLKKSFGLLVLISLFLITDCQTLKPPSNLSTIAIKENLPSNTVSSNTKEGLVSNEIIGCGSSEDCFIKAKESDKIGKREEARTYLKVILEQYKGTPWFYRSGYLLAKWDIDEKKGLADDLLIHVLNDYPKMGDYSEKLLADDAFNQGDFLKADKTDTHILLFYPDSVLRPQILIQKGTSLYKLKEYDQATELFMLFLKENPKDEKSPDVMSRLFDLNCERLDWERAGKAFREIETKYPDTNWSDEAEKKMALLPLPASYSGQFKLSAQEQFSKGKGLYEIGRFEKALEIWKKLSQEVGRDEQFLPELELKMGMAYLPLKKYTEAAEYFDRLLRKHPRSEYAPEALLGLARIAVREEKADDLDKIQKKGEQLFSGQEAYFKLLYLIGNYYDDHRQPAKAHIYYRAIVNELSQNPIAADALWREGWTSYKEGDYLSAEKNISKLLEQYPGSPLHAQGLYWRARVNEKMENKEGAVSDFKELCLNFSHSYYCHLARKRLLLGAELTAVPHDSLTSNLDLSNPAPSSYQLDEHYVKAKELMLMNLNPDASKEFNLLEDRYRDKASLLQIDKELIQAGDFYHALKSLRGQFPDILDRGRSYEFPLLWKLAYPREVVEQVERIAKDTKIEPEFVAGIMREESVFDVRATSKSGAMGLMQLMPFTGEWVAEQLGVASFVRENLYDQDMNIRFGAFYLDHLNQKFQGNLFYIAASYNAGPDAVSKWIINSNFTDIEEFVENIPYQETRYYVKRVMKSYEEFKEIRAQLN